VEAALAEFDPMRETQLGPVLRHIRRLALPPVTHGLTDVQLLERFREGREESAFAALMQRHGGLVWGVCCHLLRQEQDAEDAFQATFLVLAQRAGAIRKGEALPSWLHGTAFRIAMRAKRDAGRRRAREARAEAGRGGAPPSETAWQDLQAALDEEVQRLPPRQRTVFVLCVLEGQSQAEAADALGWGPRAVSGTLARARQRLRVRLAARGITLSAVLAGLAVAGRPAGAAPAVLAGATLRAAVAGGTSAGVSARVAALVRDAAREGLPLKLKVVTALALLAAAAGAGTVVWPAASADPPAPPPPGAAPAAARADEPDKGDDGALAESPLPAGAFARLGTSRFRHAHIVSNLAYTPDGKMIVSGSHLGTVRFWDPATGKELRVLAAHDGGVIGLAFSPDGKMMATGSWDRTIRLWDTATWTLLRTLQGHNSEVSRLAFSPEGKVLASGSQDGTARLWDPATGQALNTITAHDGYVRGIAFSPEGKRLATAGNDKMVYVWDAESGKRLTTFEGHTDRVTAVTFSPDGKTLATCGNDKTARLWDGATGKQTRLITHDSWLERVAFSPDGKLLAIAGGWGGKVFLWDLGAGGDKPRWVGRQPQSIGVAFSPDGKKLAGAGWEATVRVWDVATGKEEGAAPAGGHTGWVYAVVASPDRKTVVSTGSDGAVIVWDAAAGREVRRLQGHKDRVQCLALSPDGKTVASGGRDQTVRLWDVATGREIKKIEAGGSVKGLAFAPDGRRLASASGNDLYDGWVQEVPGHGAAVWDVPTGAAVFRLQGHDGGVKAVAYSPDGKTIATGGNDKTARLWDAGTGQELRRLEDGNGAVEAVAFSPDGKRLASAGQDGIARLWRLGADGEPVRLGEPTGWLLGAAFSPDGRTLAVARRDRGDAGALLRLWDVATGKERAHFSGHQATAAAAAFSPDGRVLVSGGGDGTVMLWDVTGRAENGKFVAADLSPPALEAEWTDLVADDGLKAHRAVWALAAAPKQALPLLRDYLKPVPAGDATRIAQLIKELDADDFDAREKASAELDKIGEPAAPALRKALEGTPSAELRVRVTNLLEKFTGKVPSADGLRRERALEVLEHIGGAEARAVLEEIGKGAPEAALTQEAKEALKRLGH
jgi:RNA polymerase sigma factor (sigma-70 family)